MLAKSDEKISNVSKLRMFVLYKGVGIPNLWI